MLPISVEARAKMKMTSGQLFELPFSRSLRVEERSWRSSISTGVGAAATRERAVAKRARNFIVALIELLLL